MLPVEHASRRLQRKRNQRRKGRQNLKRRKRRKRKGGGKERRKRVEGGDATIANRALCVKFIPIVKRQ